MTDPFTAALSWTTRSEILSQAEAVVNGPRQEEYGPPDESLGRIAQYWTVYLGKTVSAHDVALMMALLKVARTTGDYKLDSYVDGAGYIALAGELGDPTVAP